MSDLVTPDAGHSDARSASPEREWAHRQVEKKRKLRADAVAYIVINAFLVGVWAFTGFGYFWPGWVMAGWGVLLLLNIWNVYSGRPVTQADIDRELNSRR